VETPGQSARMIEWLRTKGVRVSDLTAETVKGLLRKKDLAKPARKLLRLRQEGGKTSPKKLASILACLCFDHRARGLQQFYGAHTGRWSGRRFQPHNLYRPTLKPEVLFPALERFKAGQFRELLADKLSPAEVAASSIRSMIQPAPGHGFLCQDYSSIEAVTCAWMVEDKRLLAAYRAGKDLYKLTAALLFGKPYDSIEKKSREREIAKIANLAFQYGGTHGAWAKFDSKGIATKSEVTGYVAAWKKANPLIVKFWKRTEEAAKKAVENPGKVFAAFRCRWFIAKNDFLACKLPSGRCLYYPFPEIGMARKPWGETEALHYRKPLGGSKGILVDTWGGTLVENIVQAVARDVLVVGLWGCYKRGWLPVLMVHDEILCEVPEAEMTEVNLAEMGRLMSTLPKWAEGLPVRTDGWMGKYYRKD
jgi:DNA polymerase